MAVASAPFNNEVFQAFAKYVCVLMIKMMLMSLLTGVYRMKKKVRNSCYVVLEASLSPARGGV